MAKKAKRTATAGKSKAKNSAKKSAVKAVKRPAAKKSAPKRAAKKSAKKAAKNPKLTRAAKTKNAARAAAGRRASADKPTKKSTALGTAANIARGVAGVAVAAVARRVPWAKDENDPFLLLQTDHDHVKTLLKNGEDTTERAKKGRREILDELTSSITVHEAIEEKLLYPALEPFAAAHDLVLESTQEHHVADILIKELHELDKDDEEWGAKFKVLKENIEHHISEEENKMFPIARGVMAREEQLALGARMRALKAELEK